MTITSTRLFQLAAVAAAFVFLMGSRTPARADDSTCFEILRDCYGQAATRQSAWDMWLAGLDCELSFTDCSRRAAVGR